MRERIITFLEKLGCRAISAPEGAEWVRASCPLAPWHHERGTDSRPSFGVRIPNDETHPAYHCFACGAKGSLYQLVHTLTWLSGESPKEALDYLLEEFPEPEEKAELPSPVRTRRYVRDVPEIRFLQSDLAVPSEVLDQFPLLAEESLSNPKAAKVMRWLEQERRITEKTVRDFQLRFYEGILGDLGVVFPTIARSGLVFDLRVRLIDEKRYFRLSPELTKSPVNYKAEGIFFGEHLVAPNALTWIVEGELDALRLYTLGESAVIATQGVLSKRKAFGLPSSAVILAFDADKAGHHHFLSAKSLLVPHVRHLFGVNWAWVGVKDPGELVRLEQLEEIKKRMILLYPTAQDILESKKRLTRTNVLDKIRQKIAQRRAMNLREKGE